MKSSSAITPRGAISAGRGGTAVFASGAILLATTTTLFAQSVTPGDAAQASATPFNVGRAFTFLFLTLGPFKVFGPFAAMTRGCDSSFKTRLAFQSILIAAAALLVPVTAGTRTLRSWEISVGELQTRVRSHHPPSPSRRSRSRRSSRRTGSLSSSCW